jgi:putative inorganic carbon (HCO3(-)) transporter
MDGIFQQVMGYDLFRGHIYQNRMSASFNHYNNFAGYLEVLFPISISLYVFDQKQYKLSFSILSALLGYCLIMTLSRGGYFATFVACNFMLFFCIFKLKSVNYRRLTIGLLFFLNALIIFLIIGILKLPLDLIIERLHMQAGGRLHGGIWSYAFSIFKSRPFLGHGPGSFMLIISKLKTNLSPTYAHNCYLQMLAEIGIFGLISFLLIIVIFFKNTIKSIIRKNDFLLLGFLSGILAYLIHSGFDTHLYSMQLSDFFWIILGLTIAIKRYGLINI